MWCLDDVVRMPATRLTCNQWLFQRRGITWFRSEPWLASWKQSGWPLTRAKATSDCSTVDSFEAGTCALHHQHVQVFQWGLCALRHVFLNGSHFDLPPSEIHRLMTGLPPQIVWSMTYSHRPHWSHFGSPPVQGVVFPGRLIPLFNRLASSPCRLFVSVLFFLYGVMK